MIKVIAINVNGIRAAARKGFFEWLKKQDADFVCIQEVKAQNDQIEDELYHPAGYFTHYSCAEKKGYSGVALYAKKKPVKVLDSLSYELSDSEGRYVQFDYDNNLSIVSVYLPSGTSGEQRQELKYKFMDFLLPKLKEIVKSGRKYIICGDINIAHKEIDLKNWKSNKKNSGFLPEERAWLDELFDKVGLVDAFRVVNQDAEQYTWWSNRGQAWAKNVGWRLDYQIVTPNLKDKIKSAEIYKDERFSDHAPLIMEYEV